MSIANDETIFYQKLDSERAFKEQQPHSFPNEEYRSPYWRDYARIIHSPSFRRLKGKTQLFPGKESDFFRCRLTHSLEVAQVGKSIAQRLNWLLSGRPKEGFKIKPFIDTDLVQLACLAHDLGHPPFGHIGEFALDDLMKDYGGFEGNAQTLRILCRLEKKYKATPSEELSGISAAGDDKRFGLNLTYRSLASVVKYDRLIPIEYADRVQKFKEGEVSSLSPYKGYYFTEREFIDGVKNNVLRLEKSRSQNLYTIECQIMDIADDIAYSTFDLEDSLKGGFIHPLELFSLNKTTIESVTRKVNERLGGTNYNIHDVQGVVYDVFKASDLIGDLRKIIGKSTSALQIDFEFFNATSINTALTQLIENGYKRTDWSSTQLGMYIRGIDIKYDADEPAFSTLDIRKDIRFRIEVLKRITHMYQINSAKLKIYEYRGGEIVREIFTAIKNSNGLFLPEDYRVVYDRIGNNREPDSKEQTALKMRVICDYIASMTDQYAIEFYGRLKSENPQTIFKPI